MTKRLIGILCIILCLCAFFSPSVHVHATDSGSSLSYIVYEQDSKQIVMQQNIDQQADASLLSRMMCALVVLESTINGQAVSTTDLVSPVSNSVSADGIYKLYTSKQYSIDALMKAAILANADNCARVLAYYVNPRTDYFVSLMNQTAARIGMTQTFFTSPDGSEKTLQRTTASDTRLFYEYAMKNTQFKRILTNEVTILWDSMPLINTCSVAFGLKAEFNAPTAGGVYTGTSQKGSCLIMHITLPAPESNTLTDTAAMKLIIVVYVPGAENASEYVGNLVTDVYTNFRKVRFLRANEQIDMHTVSGELLSLLAANDLYCVAPTEVYVKSYIQNISYTFGSAEDTATTQELSPPIMEGDVLGTAHLLLRDGSLQNVTIIAGNSIQTHNQAVNKLLDIYEQYKPLFFLIFVLSFVEIIILATKLIFVLRNRITR